ncbi:MAG: DUF2007 domain-containing protein [Myxococcales bacterium]|nr:DUF2007 domain-containing protein [Myxococcales bacterium]
MTDRRVRIATCRDSAEAALVRAVLTAHDVAVYIGGEHHAAMVGLGAAAISIDVWVDRDDADDALELIRELREGGEGALADDEIPADDTAPRADEVEPGGALVRSPVDTLTRLGRNKRVLLAALVGLTLQHGTAHLSARAWKRGLGLAAIQVVGWRHLAAGNLRLAAGLVVGAIVADLVGAFWQIVRTTGVGGDALPAARARG